MDFLPYLLSLLGLIAMIIAPMVKGKNMKVILVLAFLGNFFVATSYVLTANYNGAASCYLGAIQCIINFVFFESRNKKLPMWLIWIYGASFVILNLAVSVESYDFTNIFALIWNTIISLQLHEIIAIVATLMFVAGIVQKNGAKYRIWSLINILLWCTYDILAAAWAPLITHGIQVLSNGAGIVVHDIIKVKKK
jgi:hypothetical protein